MADNISIVMTLNDQISGKLKTIANTAQGCSKATEELARKSQQLGDRYKDFQKQSAGASAEALEVKRAMDEAAKSFKKTGDEADLLNFEKLKERYNDLTVSAKGYAAAAQATVKEIRTLDEEVRKMDLSGSIGQTGGEGLSMGDSGLIPGLGDKLAQSGLIQMAGNSLSNAISFAAESALGQPMAALGSSLVSGTLSGAAAGSLMGPWGTLIGAGIGALSGGLNGWTQIEQSKDESFKDYYRSLYEDANAATAERLSSGTALAAGRETTKLSFDTLLGDGEISAAFLKQVQYTANTTPFLYDDLVGISKTLLSFGTAVDDIIPTLTKVGDAGAALGLSTGDIGTVATYLGRMQSSNKASLEYLNPLNERGFSVFQWLADDQGISVGDVYTQISKGELSGGYVSDVILTQFEKLYAGMMDIQSKSTEGLDSTLQGLKENIDAAGGDAYNAMRNESKQYDINDYSGALGDKLAEVSAAAGKAQAYGENLQDQFQREALSAVLLGTTLDRETMAFSEEGAAQLEDLGRQFAEAEESYRNGSMEAGKRMADLREEAEALATAAYESSGWAQKQLDMEIEQIDATRELTRAMVSATDVYRQSNAFSKGRAAYDYEITTSVDEKTGLTYYSDQYGNAADSMLFDVGGASGLSGGKYAYGLDYVPYDEFPALLHQGERVLTAAEARALDRGVLSGLEPLGADKTQSLGDWAVGTFAFGLKHTPYDNFPALLHQGERILSPEEALKLDLGVLPFQASDSWDPRGITADRTLERSAVPIEEAILGSRENTIERISWGEESGMRQSGAFAGGGSAAGGTSSAGGGISVTVTGNEFHVRQDSDIDDIAEAIVRKLQLAWLRAGA